MKPERWQEIERICNSALDLPPGERKAFVQSACAEDNALREEVDRLLARQQEAEDFMAVPALEIASVDSGCEQASELGMNALPATLLHYRIGEKLGAGGMGEVYRARDERLKRDVAIKVLPEALAADAERLARLDREARLLASVSHPNIAAIYGLEIAEEKRFLVLELVEGETLAQRLKKGPLSLEEALEICRQIAEGVEAAHEKGIIHRDLKPANIKITPDGKIKILDFGLAKALSEDAPSVDLTQSPTITEAHTHPGVILGTAAYMSPEQAKGKALDKRTDIWAFGCVLYECLTGSCAFLGDGVTDTVARILRVEPDWSLIPESTPPGIRTLLRRCLHKDRTRRQHDIADARIELEETLANLSEVVSGFGPGALPRGSGIQGAMPKIEPVLPRRRWVTVSVFAILLVLSVLATVFATRYFTRSPVQLDLSSYRYTSFARETEVEANGAWSPDGKSIAYLKSIGRRPQLMVRSLDAPTATELTKIPNGLLSIAFWSPDGNRIYFIAQNLLWSVSCAGGEPQRELPEMTDVFAATLSPDAKILVCLRGIKEKESRLKSLWISSPLGAPPRKYSSAPFETEPIFLPNYLKFSPDGSQIGYSYFAEGGGGGFQLLDWPDGPNARTRRIFQNQRLSPPSFDWLPDSRHMIISNQGNLWLGDVKTGELMRFTKPIAGAEYHPSVSPDGKRVVISVQTSDYDIAEIPLDGGTRAWPLLATSGSEEYPSRSYLGDRIAFVGNPPGGYGIWLRSGQGDWQRLIVTRKDFPDDKGGNFHFAAISPDGLRVAYSRTNPAKIWISPTAGGRPAPAMPDIDQREIACSWSPNSAALASVIEKKGIYSLGVIQVGSKNPPRYIPAPTLRTAPAWSPDDQWIAYGSSEPNLILVSPDGEKSRKLPSPVAPSVQRFVLVWSRDSTTIYVADSHGVSARLYAVDIKSGKSRQVADLGPDIDFVAPLNLGLSGYLAADGKSFVTNVVNSRSDLWIMEGFPQPVAERYSWLDALASFFTRK